VKVKQSTEFFLLCQRFSNVFISRTPKSFIYFLRSPEFCKQRIDNRLLATHEQKALMLLSPKQTHLRFSEFMLLTTFSHRLWYSGLDFGQRKLVEHPFYFDISAWFQQNLTPTSHWHITVTRKSSKGALRLCRAALHSKNLQKLLWFIVFHISN